MINFSLLKEITETAGAPGYESKVRKIVLREIENLSDHISVDNMGNVIALKKGKDSSKKIMAAAHMDEIGFMVKHINDEGFLRFQTLGGFDPKTLTAQRVIVHGKKDLVGVMGCKPIHVMSPEERTKSPALSDYFIDLGLPKEEVEKWVSVGDTATRIGDLIEMGDCVTGKSLDNRVSVFILIETLRELKTPAFDFYAVFTVQEEVGIRGAHVAAHHISPDFGIGLDVTIAYDLPGAKPDEMITKLGNGTAIKVFDTSAICDYRMIEFMKQTAQKHQIEWQPEVLSGGGTDTAGMQRMSTQGVIAGAISIPTRNMHQTIEMAHKKDIRLSIDLLKNCVEEMDAFDWTHQ